jgi:nucleotide-binding universal stress UspA family protein
VSKDAPVVVVGIDGSEEATHALRWAADYVQRLGAGVVHAISVWHQPVQFGYRLSTSDTELERRARESLDSAVEAVRSEYPRVLLKSRLLRGHPVDEMVSVSEQADMMVVGNQGHGAFTGMMVGSVALKLVHHARCPILVVR